MGPSVASAARRCRLGVALAALVAVAAHGPSSPPVEVVATAQAPATPVQAGRAVAVTVGGALLNASVADTGEVRDPASSPVRRRVVEFPGPVLSGEVAEAGVVIPAPGSVRSEASVTDLRVDLLGGGGDRTLQEGGTSIPGESPGPSREPGTLLSISLPEVTVVSQSSCADGASGQTRVGAIFVNDIRVTTGGLPGPNTRVAVGQLPLVSIVLNEQVPVTAAGRTGLTVNAVRVTVANLVDLVVASARSEVGDCPPKDAPPPEPPVAEVQPDVVRRGRVTVVRGSRFPPSATVQVTFDGPDLRPLEAVAGPDGGFEAPLVVPRDAVLGDRTLTATAGDRSTTATFLVLRRPASPPGAPFADSG